MRIYRTNGGIKNISSALKILHTVGDEKNLVGLKNCTPSGIKVPPALNIVPSKKNANRLRKFYFNRMFERLRFDWNETLVEIHWKIPFFFQTENSLLRVSTYSHVYQNVRFTLCARCVFLNLHLILDIPILENQNWILQDKNTPRRNNT